MKTWDVVAGDILRDYTDFTGLVDSVAFNLDGTRFAFTSEDGLRVFNFSTTDDITTLTDQELFALPEGASVTFSPYGTRLAAASGSATAGNSIKVWDAGTGQEFLTLAGHTSWVMGIAFSPDGKSLISTSLDGTVKVWSLLPGSETVTILSPPAVYGIRVAYSPKEQEFATNAGDGTARIWNAETGELQQTLTGHAMETMSVAFRPDGTRLATGSLDGTAIVWDKATGKELFALSAHQDGVRDIALAALMERRKSGMPPPESSFMRSRATRAWCLEWLSARMGNSWPHQAQTRPQRFGMQERANYYARLPVIKEGYPTLPIVLMVG
jgi:WD40 repeat protein